MSDFNTPKINSLGMICKLIIVVTIHVFERAETWHACLFVFTDFPILP